MPKRVVENLRVYIVNAVPKPDRTPEERLSPQHFRSLDELRRLDQNKDVAALIKDLKKDGWYLVPGGKGDHRKFRHASKPGSVIIPHGDNQDAAPYLEKQVREAISRK